MSITRYGTGSTAAGGQPRPFARAVEADGWLHVSGQVPALDGEIIVGGIVEQTHQTMKNLIAILEEAGYGLEDVVRAGVWLEDPRDFSEFQQGVLRVLQARTRPGAGLCAGEHDGRLQGRDRLHCVQEKGLNRGDFFASRLAPTVWNAFPCGSEPAREGGLTVDAALWVNSRRL